MSFKDLRDLSESLRNLGYSNSLPLQSLSSNNGSLNNFNVIADILKWMIGRIEPGASFFGDTATESDRIFLIKSVTEFFVAKSSVVLNPRKLYASSSASVKELLKITNILNVKHKKVDNKEENLMSLSQSDMSDKLVDLRRTRELSSKLTKQGATLHDLLSKEVINREKRINQPSRSIEPPAIERVLKNAITSTELKLQSLKNQLETFRVEKSAIYNKLQRKKAELDRSKQRLEALQKIRPAYLEEFEQYEYEIRDLFQKFFLRIHCRDALKAQINARMKNLTPIATPMNKINDTSMIFVSEGLIDEDDDIEKNNEQANNSNDNFMKSLKNIDGNWNKNSEELKTQQTKVRPITGRLKPKTGITVGKHKIIGNMLGDPDDEMLDTTIESGDSDDIILDGAECGFNSDDEISLSNLMGETTTKVTIKQDNHSDEDF